MNYLSFGIGIWHPFGPHGRETPEQIIERKRAEIERNGWTFWSFQYRTTALLGEWYRELSSGGQTAFAFCSKSKNAVDPAVAGKPIETTERRSFRFVSQNEWRPFPTGVRVPHPFRERRRQASAFVVHRIVYPVEVFSAPPVEWLSKGTWRNERLPTRGEYLIRVGGTNLMRPVRAVLELREPYLALVRADAV